jgi:hypothetical protein
MTTPVPYTRDANWWRHECNYIDGAALVKGKMRNFNYKTSVFISYCEMQRDTATKDGRHDSATYIQEVIDDLKAHT